MKSVEIKGGEELSDFTVEIDILAECQHPNIVKLMEAFFFQDNLFVSALPAHHALLSLPGSCPVRCRVSW